jgi:ankyrin repeat protein
VSKGVQVNIKDWYGWTPLHWGEIMLNIIVGILINFVPFIASRKGHKDVVEYLLSKGADVTGKDSAGKTPLHLGE